MYLNQIILKNLNGEPIFLRAGDELVQPGIPAHKRAYVGPIGPYGEDVVDPAKGQAPRFVHLHSIPNWQQFLVGERGPEDWQSRMQVQARAHEVVSNGVVNRTLGPNCDHITSYIRNGKPESPQLKFWGGIAVGVAFCAVIAAIAD
jgi:hypothetical protein